MEDLKLAIATIETQLDEVRNALKQLEEKQVTTNWYDFTDEQREKLSGFVESFINRQIRNARTTVDTYSSDNGFDIEIRFDCEDLINDIFGYNPGDNFIEFLEDEITEQRENERKDCEESN